MTFVVIGLDETGQRGASEDFGEPEVGEVALLFTADKTGEFAYFCSLPGHRQAGMEGRIQVVPGLRAAAGPTAPDIVRDPADLPPPIGERPPQVVRVDLNTIELKGQLNDKTTYTYWTFNGKVPGPFIRVRVGDTLEVHLKNDQNSLMIHSVDFHAAIGPGGGAEFTQTDPGQESIVTFKALIPWDSRSPHQKEIFYQHSNLSRQADSNAPR